jgi:hypothetical protein
VNALPVVLRAGVVAACLECGAGCQGTLYGPSRIVGEAGCYSREDVGPVCPPCHSRIWRSYLEGVRERMALIRYSAQVGYPARRSELEAARRRGGVQLWLFGAQDPHIATRRGKT